MHLSARRLALLCALPVVAATIGISAWAAWQSGSDRDALARLGLQATMQHSTTEAISALSTEIYALDTLEALPDDVPQELTPYLRENMTLSGNGRTFLEFSDRRGAKALVLLTGAEVRLRPETRLALSRLSDADLQRAASGRMPAAVTMEDYAGAISELQGLFASQPATTAAAVDELVRRGDAPPPWQRPAFVAGLAVVWTLAAVLAFILGRLVSARLRVAAEDLDSERTRMAELTRRNDRLLELADAGHRVSSRTDMKGVTDAVAAEAALLLRADVAAVFLVEGDRAVPVGSSGAYTPRDVDCEAGILGRALGTGAPARGVASSDPALPGLSPASVLAAPLIAGRRIIGAILVGRAGDAALDEEDALALRLIGLAAATAIEGARAQDSVTALALTDALTGLGNRRRLDADLQRACAPGSPRPVGLVMIDVDNFKSYNDSHGHPAGDEVLRRVAAIASANVREHDIVYRFGGEELCVILPDANREEATRIAERIRAAVAAYEFAGGETQPGGRLTISAGVACDDGPEAGRLMAAADEALYRAKREGRDRVVTAA